MAITLDTLHSRWNWAWLRSDKTTTVIMWSYDDDRKIMFVNKVLSFVFLNHQGCSSSSRWSLCHFLPIDIYMDLFHQLFVYRYLQLEMAAMMHVLRPLLVNSIIKKNDFLNLRINFCNKYNFDIHRQEATWMKCIMCHIDV